MKYYVRLFFLGLIFFIIVPVVAMEAECSQSLLIQYGVSARQGDRSAMEDVYNIEFPFGGNTDEAFVGLYDGHGGVKVAKFAKDDLCNNVVNLFFGDSAVKADDETQLKNAFYETENFLAKCDYTQRMGSTAIVAWVKRNKIIFGWLGDSRAVLADRHGEIVWQSKDHKPNTPPEARRILKSMGTLFQDQHGSWRVGKKNLDIHLSVSRTFGDIELKNELSNGPVSADPDIQTVAVTPDHEFIILACDGVWDVMDSKQAVMCVRSALDKYEQKGEKDWEEFFKALHRGNKLQQVKEVIVEESNSTKALYAAQFLRDKAYAKGSEDNISVIVILLNQ